MMLSSEHLYIKGIRNLSMQRVLQAQISSVVEDNTYFTLPS